jgi:hypothetical protein
MPARQSAASTVTSTCGRCWCLLPSAPESRRSWHTSIGASALSRGRRIFRRPVDMTSSRTAPAARGEGAVVEPAVDRLLEHGEQDGGGLLGEVAG